MKTIIFLILILAVIIISALICGRNETYSLFIKCLSPICIISFWLLNISIVKPIAEVLNNYDILNALEVASARVAVDSAILTLLVNTLLYWVSTPIDVSIDIRSSKDLYEIETFCNRSVRASCAIKVDFKRKIYKYLFWKKSLVHLRILNTDCTSIVVDKVSEYEGIIDDSKLSKYVDIDLTKLSPTPSIKDTLYMNLYIMSDKSIKWDREISIELKTSNKASRMLWRANECKIKLVHREETT